MDREGSSLEWKVIYLQRHGEMKTYHFTETGAGVNQEGLRFVLKCLSCEMENF